jgi:chromosome segregation protein
MKKRDVVSHIDLLRLEEETFNRDTVLFEEELREGRILVGPSIREFEEYQLSSDDQGEQRAYQEERRKKIERIKIRLEDAGGVGADDILKEYDETTKRDEFLSKELSDLEESVRSTSSLIETLRTELDQTFKEGIEKINQQFQEFFRLMFGGGDAFLSLVADRPKRIKKISEDEMSEEEILESKIDDGEEKRIEYGIDVNISLPRKKVRDLGMLSGGERSLTSIALLFSISQVNPPPFMVLDETDAALDEANSRRYGDMVENLGKQSQLIVVTHNRETMSRANVLYGVTIGADGGSKLLSIKFDDAEQWAK